MTKEDHNFRAIVFPLPRHKLLERNDKSGDACIRFPSEPALYLRVIDQRDLVKIVESSR